MNSFVVVVYALFVVACSALFGSKREEFKKNFEACKAELNATDADIQGMMMHHMQDAPSRISYCMIACIKKKSGVMTADNKINMEKLKQEMSGMQSHNPEMYTKMMEPMQQCRTTVESKASNLVDGCTAVQAMMECVKAKMQS